MSRGRTRRGWTTATWTALLAAAVLWPSRVIGLLDGVPLDQRTEALLIGFVLPSLWWLDRPAIASAWSRVLIVSLLAWKIGATALLGQQGLCAASFAKAPLHGTVQGIPIEEPSGALRSWDLRADFSAAVPTCTAILARPLPAQADFPAWFLNITDSMPATRDFTMAVRGYVDITTPRTLTIDAQPNMQLAGRVDQQPFSGAPLLIAPGTHDVDLSLRLDEGEWRFDPRLDGRPLWDEALVTTHPPTIIDRLVASWGWLVAPALIFALLALLLNRLVRQLVQNWALAAWMVGSAGAAALLAVSSDANWHRAAGLLSLTALVVPTKTQLRGLRGAFLLVGVPWLTFFGARSLQLVGRFSIYLPLDDWLTFQVASHRIYMQGYWLEGGNPVFSFQPLYRWTTGALHMIFGDSSVGEVYLDAACLLMGALVAFHFVKARSGFRWGVAAASAVLATYTLSTTWHFIGRGLSEIVAAGWAFLAMFLLWRGRHGSRLWVASAGLCAVLMSYARLNHLLFAPFLAALLLPLRVPAAFNEIIPALRRIRPTLLIIFVGVFALGVLGFAARTWYYTGIFSLFYGTSLPNHDIGLRPWTIFDPSIWSAIAHSLAALFSMNEPPWADPRSLVVVAGALVATAAVLQLPIARKAPAALVLVAVGASVGSLLVHVHAYPGRISIHLVPLMSALTFTTLASVPAFVKRRDVA